MKKLLTAILCAMLLMSCACAESPAIPAPELESVSAEGSMSATINGSAINLAFDPDPLFSIVQNGYIQASFYAYDANNNLYELYMTFPQAVQSSESITPESSIAGNTLSSGLMLYVTDSASEVCSGATQHAAGAYPEGSSYTLTFSEVTSNGSLCTFTGTITAALVEVDRNFNPSSNINDFTAVFSFTMDLGSAAAPAPEATQPPSEDIPPDQDDIPKSEVPAEPQQQYPPTPPEKLVTPADAQKI